MSPEQIDAYASCLYSDSHELESTDDEQSILTEALMDLLDKDPERAKQAFEALSRSQSVSARIVGGLGISYYALAVQEIEPVNRSDQDDALRIWLDLLMDENWHVASAANEYLLNSYRDLDEHAATKLFNYLVEQSRVAHGLDYASFDDPPPIDRQD